MAMETIDADFPEAARYYPFERGLYEVSPNLKPFGTDFGNGPADQRLFQLDREFPRYRSNKTACRGERLGKYLQTQNFKPDAAARVNAFLIERLTAEYPQFFIRQNQSLWCGLTGETLEFDSAPPYASPFDAICSQVQEDVAVMQTAPDGSNWLSALHVCSPSQWAPEDKIGRDFLAVHSPVPGMEKTLKAAPTIADAMVNKGPFVRFVWGVVADDRLNHHPEPPPGLSRSAFADGRSFDFDPPFVRLERQVIWGLPEIKASVFTIRTYLIPGDEIKRDRTRREQLRAGLLSMSPSSRAYKSIAGCFNELIGWL